MGFYTDDYETSEHARGRVVWVGAVLSVGYEFAFLPFRVRLSEQTLSPATSVGAAGMGGAGGVHGTEGRLQLYCLRDSDAASLRFLYATPSSTACEPQP